MVKLSTLLVSFLLTLSGAFSQEFTRQDTLRGAITPERAWWDLQHYELSVEVDPENKFISGTNWITYKVLSPGQVMQIDLQEPMKITKVTQGKANCGFTRERDVYFITLPDQTEGTEMSVSINFEGNPTVAKRAPWDGGFSWSKDENGKHFIATSNQGIGSSIWWPCKDHPFDEPDKGVTEHFTVPKGLTAVGNGRLIKVKKGKSMDTFTWKVLNPINDYGINLNIGDYAKFEEKYAGENGELDMIYYVLSYNLEKAKIHFEDAKRTIEAFEYWFGPYPFYEDSYKLVEVPYLGMEHQSSVTYGNNYEKGYRGRDLSMTGWGLKWDYIIIHETGHEWFANNITYQDVADMWVHESFTTYSESLFTEYFYGKEAGAAYVRGMRYGISNEEPIVGTYGVNQRGADLYNKGSNLLHTLRQLVNDDEKWRNILRGLNKEFYHQTVTSEMVENYISQQSGLDLDKFFDQYLRDPRVPVLEYFTNEGKLLYRWTNCIDGFEMPVRARIGENEMELTPTARWNFRGDPVLVEDIETFQVDPNFYIYPVLIIGNN